MFVLFPLIEFCHSLFEQSVSLAVSDHDQPLYDLRLFQSVYTMVSEAKKQFAVTLCNCGKPFQGDRFKKHLQQADSKFKSGHAKEKVVYYCPKCNVWGEENEVFSHPHCPRLSFAKADLSLILKRVVPESRVRLLKAASDKDEVKAAVATITEPKVAKDTEADTQWADLFGPPLSDDSDIINPPKKRRIVDLDDSEGTLPSPQKTSTPNNQPPPPSPPKSSSKSPHLPRTGAEEINLLYHHNKLKSENNRLKGTISSLNVEIGLLKGKETLNKRLSEDLKVKTEAVRQAESLLAKEREEREKDKRRFEELVRKSQEDARRSTEEAEAIMKRAREEREKEKIEAKAEMVRLKKELEERLAQEKAKIVKRREEKDHVLIHVELADNKMRRRHAETSLEESTCCYSHPAEKVRCLHIEVSGIDTHTKVRNVRWPSGKSK